MANRIDTDDGKQIYNHRMSVVEPVPGNIETNTVKSYKDYWDCVGKTFEDIDGYRVVLQNREWTVVALRIRYSFVE